MLGLVVEVAIFSKSKGSKAKGHFRLQIRVLNGIGCHTLELKRVVDKTFLGVLPIERAIKAS